MKKINRLVLTALFAALTCAATMVIRIPIPLTNGYIHPGDAIVILCGVFLGPLYGAMAAGIGSAFSDLFGGYVIYVPITFVIKAAVAFFVGHVYGVVERHKWKRSVGVLLGGMIDVLLVVLGYFVCEVPLYGTAAAAVGMIPNLIQGMGGCVMAMLLYPVFSAIPEFRTSCS